MTLLIASGVRSALRGALKEADLKRDSLRGIISTSTRAESMMFFAGCCGFIKEQVFMHTLSDVSHSFSSDVIINLAEGGEWIGALGTGAFLALSLGPSNWGAMVLRPVL